MHTPENYILSLLAKLAASSGDDSHMAYDNGRMVPSDTLDTDTFGGGMSDQYVPRRMAELQGQPTSQPQAEQQDSMLRLKQLYDSLPIIRADNTPYKHAPASENDLPVIRADNTPYKQLAENYQEDMGTPWVNESSGGIKRDMSRIRPSDNSGSGVEAILKMLGA